MIAAAARYIPAGAIRVADKASTAVAYIYQTGRGKPAAIVYAGKATKPAWHFNFANELTRERRVRGFFEGVRATEKARADRAAKRKAWVHPYKVGDLFNTCWGYDQTNREFYEVVDVRGKHLIVRQIRSGYVETQWLAGKALPLPGDYIGEPSRVLAQDGGFRCPRYSQWAMFMEPTMRAGIKTYDAAHVSSYH